MQTSDLTEQGFRLVIGMPSYDMRVSQMQVPMIYGSELPPTQFIPVAGAYIDRGRNRIVEAALSGTYDEALGGPPTHLLMLDSDAFPRDPRVIRKLFEARVSAISAMVAFKEFPSYWMVFQWADRAAHDIRVMREIIRTPLEPFNLLKPYRDVFEIDACGYGMILLDMDVFKQIEPPWFETWQSVDLQYHGEDVIFHRKMQDAGIKTYAHGGAQCIHQDGKKFYPDFVHNIGVWMEKHVSGASEGEQNDNL